ncbi:MAG: mandelate racemase/muconate lactonizing enzyme family protein [Betaproteobacteria bacterium]|nr:mandelate racemase/muconate lactonizing enzyme family protein [Betaproteobacteria bacterium]
MQLASSTLRFYRLPYMREVRWANALEDGGLFALLELVADSGARGFAEGTVKATWSGASPRSLAAQLEDLLIPRLKGIDLADQSAVARAIAPVQECRLAKALVDNACWTLRACAANMPLWKLWGGPRLVELTWAVTRQPPDAMAREAAEVISRYGFPTLKVKGGQGLDTDLRALAGIRAAVGERVQLTVDANGAYPTEHAAAYVRAIADAGVTVAEDPCPLAPDAGFERLQRESPIPILVDNACTSTRDASLFLERGARALSVKPGRVGLSESRAIAASAALRGQRVALGLYAESALGTLISLQFAPANPITPAEQSFYLEMREQVLNAELRIADGRIELPEVADLATLIDWSAIDRYAVQP